MNTTGKLALPLLLLLSLFCNAQVADKVNISATPNIQLHPDTSYLYCASMEMAWNELATYLGELPRFSKEIATVEALNTRINEHYQRPLEERFVVSEMGTPSDSVIFRIQKEMLEKFGKLWSSSTPLSPSSLLLFAYLQRDVSFKYPLDDHFYKLPFKDSEEVDYFGVDFGDPDDELKFLRIFDYKSPDDFIVNIQCKDSLDELYFAKIPMEESLQATWEAVSKRLLESTSYCGSDQLRIPYIQFNITKEFPELIDQHMVNEGMELSEWHSANQQIFFDLNEQGILLESKFTSIIDFGEEDLATPRVLTFDQPFLLIMKRKNAPQPYFLYWVAGVECMRNYALPKRNLVPSEQLFVGTWLCTKALNHVGKPIHRLKDLEGRIRYEFHDNGTYCIILPPYEDWEGIWNVAEDRMEMRRLINSDGKFIDSNFHVTRRNQKRLVLMNEAYMFKFKKIK